MSIDNDLGADVPGRLTENIMHFGRLLRAAGLPVGTGKVLDAVHAVTAAGIARRDDFYWTLHAVFVNRRDQRPVFDQAFHVFWRNPAILERMMSLLLPTMRGEETLAEGPALSRRVAEALRIPDVVDAAGEAVEPDEIAFDAAMTWSGDEVLRAKDFEDMSSDETREALAVIRRMRMPLMSTPTRRFRPDPSGRLADMRATLRAALRSGSDFIPFQWRRRRTRHPPLVVLCDISGSMDRYGRMLLHFLHAVTNDRDRVHTFLFGTRLTNVTRYLRHKDVDAALVKVGQAVEDWAGGTRIGHCLHVFNARWSRRVLGQGAVVLLITDGLDREDGRGLGDEMERLRKSCRRLIWLNPLLRYERFEPRSLGVRAILPHVDDFRPVHNLESLADLARALSSESPRRPEPMARWRETAA
ncbi:MAG: VWA domain-containing protein [Rhodospirillales bacterium]|jgi:hypothetical protein|nr:VWA domain-containing protein [Rhodospirillales bacterium]